MNKLIEYYARIALGIALRWGMAKEWFRENFRY